MKWIRSLFGSRKATVRVVAMPPMKWDDVETAIYAGRESAVFKAVLEVMVVRIAEASQDATSPAIRNLPGELAGRAGAVDALSTLQAELVAMAEGQGESLTTDGRG